MEKYYPYYKPEKPKYLYKTGYLNGFHGIPNGKSIYARARPFLHDAKRDNVTVYDSHFSRQISPMDVLSRLEKSVLKRMIRAEVEDEEPLIVGLRSEVNIRVWGDDLNSVLFNSLEIQTECEKDVKIIEWTAKRERTGSARKILLKFLPKKIGTCSIILRSKISWFEDRTVTLEIEGNNPLMSFSDGSDWPIAITARPYDRSVFVAYIHHVSRFSEEGEFEKEVAREKVLFFNDIAVDETGRYLAASVSGWITEGKTKYRFQEVRLYNMYGGILWKIGGDLPIFLVPVLHLTFDKKGRVLVAAHDSICRCDAKGRLEVKASADNFGMCSRMALANTGDIIVLDAAYGYFHLFNENLVHLARYPVTLMVDEDSQNSIRGLTGVAVDTRGYVLISDCVHNTIVIYKLDGTKVGFIESEWDFMSMPLDVGVADDGHVFVADHANGCIKKYKYLTDKEIMGSRDYYLNKPVTSPGLPYRPYVGYEKPIETPSYQKRSLEDKLRAIEADIDNQNYKLMEPFI